MDNTGTNPGVGDAYRITALVTSGSASGFTSSQSGVAAGANIDAATLTNTSDSDATVSYTVTAYTFGPDGIDNGGGGDDCLDNATPITVAVTVEPEPKSAASATMETVCSGDAPMTMTGSLNNTGSAQGIGDAYLSLIHI